MTLAGDLLAVSLELCPAGTGRPSHAHLRRSISTSYYAAFHALSDEVARPYARDVRLSARRMLDHGSARDVALTLMNGKMPWLAGRPDCHSHVKQFAEDFENLQLARHRADYDLAYTPTKADAQTAMQRAERALVELANARRSCADQLQAMCVAMVASPNLRKRMAR